MLLPPLPATESKALSPSERLMVRVIAAISAVKNQAISAMLVA
jgi:hypothetical protein